MMATEELFIDMRYGWLYKIYAYTHTYAPSCVTTQIRKRAITRKGGEEIVFGNR